MSLPPRLLEQTLPKMTLGKVCCDFSMPSTHPCVMETWRIRQLGKKKTDSIIRTSAFRVCSFLLSVCVDFPLPSSSRKELQLHFGLTGLFLFYHITLFPFEAYRSEQFLATSRCYHLHCELDLLFCPLNLFLWPLGYFWA